MLDTRVAGVPVLLTLLVVLFFAVCILVLVIWSIRRHRAPTLRIECDSPISEQLRALAGLTNSAIYSGNSVELFENGAFFEALFEEIKVAKQSVHFETFLWKKGMLGQRLINALLERRSAGVEVRVIVDGDGGKNIGDDVQQRLLAAGCKFVFHHPKRFKYIGVYSDRDHRKLVVLDGRVAFVCGHCIVDSWLGDAESSDHVRDLGVRLRGPVVHAVQTVFSENWVEDTGELFVGEDVFPELKREGNVDMHIASLKPEGSPSAVKVLHHLVICMARKTIRIQNPYFLPEDEAIEAFGKAVARGVDVRVMVPSANASDMPMVQHAAHHKFEKMLELGIRIFEYQTCLLHQKVMSIDGEWCAIGSSNFDDRSFETNDEVTLSIRDRDFAERLDQVFAWDCARCVELKLDTWRARGIRHRLKDRALHVFNELL